MQAGVTVTRTSPRSPIDRLSPLLMPTTSTPRAIPNSPSTHRRRQSSFGLTDETKDDSWLDITARELAAEERDESGWLEIGGDVPVERAVEVRLCHCGANLTESDSTSVRCRLLAR
jgi:hypothetical protein